MSVSESTYRVKCPKRMANKRSNITTPKGSTFNQTWVVIEELNKFVKIFQILNLNIKIILWLMKVLKILN